MRVGIVTTLRNAVALESFTRYHLAIGFDHIFLFFDDPNDPQIHDFENHSQITVIRGDDDLRRKWIESRSYKTFEIVRRFLDREIMARQILNVEIAMNLAVEKKIDWILHIDSDELFYSPDQSVKKHFQELEKSKINHAVYPNYEAVPEKINIDNPFKEVTLFKINRDCVDDGQFSDLQISSIKSVPQLADRFFLFYTNGKAAARVSEGLLAGGVHRFFSLGVPCKRERILHYACCGFENFWNKYRTLGHFDDRWFGWIDIKVIEPFHLDARDIVAKGDRNLAREFYTKRVMISDKKIINRLIYDGVFTRIAPSHRHSL